MNIAYNNPKVGIMNITHEMHADRELMSALMKHVTVLNAQQHESGRGIEYIVSCELFDDLKEGEEIPEYRIEMCPPGMKFDNDEYEQRKQVGTDFRFVAIRQFIIRAPVLSTSLSVH